MVIKYKKSYLWANLIYGLIFFLLFAINFFFEDEIRWIDYLSLLVAGGYVGKYFYCRHHGYLTLENAVLRRNDLRKKQINFHEVVRFKSYAGDYILESNSRKLKVNTAVLDPPSVVLLKAALEKYGLKPGTSRNLQTESN